MAAASTSNSAGHGVAIVSDGSALPDGGDLTTTLREDAERISGLAGIPVRPRIVTAADATGLAAGIRALPADVSAVLLTQVAPERARDVQCELQEGRARPLLTDDDATAIALTAATLGSLARAGRRAWGHRVVLAGAQELPALTTLLMAAGVDDITTWNYSDAVIFPLRTVVFGADVVIDLATGVPSTVDDDLDGITVITREDTAAAPYAVAGLLRAAVHAPGLAFDVDIFRACAQALTTVSSPPTPAPTRTGAALTRRVADAVTRVFHTQLSQ